MLIKFQCPYSFIFVPVFPSGKVAGAATLGGPEISHDQQQSQKVPLGPHQDRAKQGRRYSHTTWSFDDLSAALPTYWKLSGDGSDSEKWLDILSFTDFKPVHFVTKCHTLNSSQNSHLSRLFLGKCYFCRYSRLITTDDDRNKDRFNNWKLCDLWKSPFSPQSNKAHAEMRLLSESVYPSLCSNFRACEYHHTVLGHFNITCCSVLPLTCRIHCFGRLERHSFLLGCTQLKPIRCI